MRCVIQPDEAALREAVQMYVSSYEDDAPAAEFVASRFRAECARVPSSAPERGAEDLVAAWPGNSSACCARKPRRVAELLLCAAHRTHH